MMTLEMVKKEWHGTFKSYAIGFTLSLLLTIVSFLLVATKALEGGTLLFAIGLLALIQATVQVLCFLHLGKEAKPQWETYVFYFMILVLAIIVGGSLWIMYDLNERVMSHMQMGMGHP